MMTAIPMSSAQRSRKSILPQRVSIFLRKVAEELRMFAGHLIAEGVKNQKAVMLIPFAVILSGPKNLRGSFTQGKLREASLQFAVTY